MPLDEFLAFLACAAVCLLSYRYSWTYEHPDEYWQGPEIAHKIYYGYGILSWEWDAMIRNYLFPSLLAAGYYLTELVGTKDEWKIINGPRTIATIASVLGGISVYKLSKRFYGTKAAITSLFFYLTSPLFFFFAPRTFSNVMEMNLVAMGIYFWPFEKEIGKLNKPRFTVSTLILTLAVAIRPTPILLFLFLISDLLCKIRRNVKELISITAILGISGILGITSLLLVDRYFYGVWVISHLNFFTINIYQSASGFFGENSRFILIRNFLIISGAAVVPFLTYCWKEKNKKLLYLCVAYITIYIPSIHHEIRFLLPILPLICIAAGRGYIICTELWPKRRKIIERQLITLGIVTILFSMLFSIYISPHNLQISKWIHDDIKNYEERNSGVDDYGVTHMNNCFYTPGYSHIHRNIPFVFPSCVPSSIKRTDGTHYNNEVEMVVENPRGFLEKYFDPDFGGYSAYWKDKNVTRSKPYTLSFQRVLVLDLTLENVKEIENVINDMGYTKVKTFCRHSCMKWVPSMLSKPIANIYIHSTSIPKSVTVKD